MALTNPCRRGIAGLPIVPVILLFAACESVPTGQPDAPKSVPAAPAEKPVIRTVRKPDTPPVEVRDPIGLADAALHAAHRAPAVERARLLLTAAENYMRGGRTPAANRVITALGANPALALTLRPAEQYRLDLLLATRQFRRQRFAPALSILNRLSPSADVEPSAHARMWQLKAYAQALDGDPLAAAHSLVRRADYLNDIEIQANHEQIWNLINTLPDAEVNALANGPRQRELIPKLADWIELADIARRPVEPQAVESQQPRRTALENWRAGTRIRHLDWDWLSTLAPARWQVNTPKRVALLLPLSSRFAGTAGAIKDGFMAAHRQNAGAHRPRVVVYDSGPDTSGALENYQHALAAGVDFVVGPLGRAAAEAIGTAPAARVPGLVLGHLSEAAGDSPAPLYQFDLDPEQEAAAVARYAYRDGHRRVALLRPHSNWGRRLAEAFRREWLALGGRIVGELAYRRGAVDYSGEVKRLLNIDQSQARSRRVARIVGHQVKFAARRRQDIDFVFLIARPAEGRLIRPQLSFHQAHDLPVYSTSHIYSGAPDPVNDKDLEGVRLCVMPSLLRRTPGYLAALPGAPTGFARAPAAHPKQRLYALGYDAYELVPFLVQSWSQPMYAQQGWTGRLNIGPRDRIMRQPEFAQIRDGRLIVAPPMDYRPLSALFLDRPGESQRNEQTDIASDRASRGARRR